MKTFLLLQQEMKHNTVKSADKMESMPIVQQPLSDSVFNILCFLVLPGLNIFLETILQIFGLLML